MRKRFEQQLEFGEIPIGSVKINLNSRHELPPVLFALQYVFNDKKLSEEIFQILEEQILKGKYKTGRNGMSLWEILVLGVTRLSLDIDFDFLHDMSNNHKELRGILGVGSNVFNEKGKEYHYQTLKDNVQLLDEETIKLISVIIVKGGHGLVKKKEGKACLNLVIKSDSFVVESNIHFPTDMNLLYDSMRKCLDMIGSLKQLGAKLMGWGQYYKWYKKIKKVYRICSEIHRKKGANYHARLKKAAQNYLRLCERLVKKLEQTRIEGAAYMVLHQEMANKRVFNLLKDLNYYFQMANKHADLLKRRILLGEKIPHSEKIFSIFEPHVEWNAKGKSNKQVELGHNVLIATDQYQFILYHEVYEKQVDKSRTIAIGKGIGKNFSKPEYQLSSISFDRNFFSFPAKKELQKLYKQVILPKPGKKSHKQQEEESSKEFVEKRMAHSAVEANINQLEHHGLGICRDKGIEGFKRYVAYGVLSYNLHQLGRILMVMERKKHKKAA